MKIWDILLQDGFGDDGYIDRIECDTAEGAVLMSCAVGNLGSCLDHGRHVLKVKPCDLPSIGFEIVVHVG